MWINRMMEWLNARSKYLTVAGLGALVVALAMQGFIVYRLEQVNVQLYVIEYRISDAAQEVEASRKTTEEIQTNLSNLKNDLGFGSTFVTPSYDAETRRKMYLKELQDVLPNIKRKYSIHKHE